MKKERIFLLDAYALIYRGYYAFIKNPRINSKGNDTSAIFGFLNSFLELYKREKPEYICVAFDSGKTFRHDIYTEYKSNRQSTPEPIKWGIPIIKEILKLLGVNIIEIEGYEADDIIGTIAKKAEENNLSVYMMSLDKDFCQLVSDNIFLYKPNSFGNGIEIMGTKEVIEKYELERVEQIIDYLAMMGDASDNIPGLPSVGEKTAKKLLKEYHTIENLLDNANNIKGSLGEKISANRELGLLSKRLVTIETNIPLEFIKDNYTLGQIDLENIKKIFEDLEFRRTFDSVKLLFKENKITKPTQISMFEDEDIKPITNNIKNTDHHYQLVDTPFAIEMLIKKLLEQKEVCFDTETTSLNIFDAELIGIAFSWEKGKGFFLKLPTNREEVKKILTLFNPFFESENILKIGHNIKYDLHIMSNYDICVKGELFDTMVAHYLLNSNIRQDMDTLAKLYLNYDCVPIEELIGKRGPMQLSMQSVNIEQIKEYAVEDADITLQLKHIFEEKLKKEKTLYNLFKEIEMPLVRVLKNMEREGVSIDKEFLKSLSVKINDEITILEKNIRTISGEPDFNISSPKQLGEVLFDKMKIANKAKKTKTGQYATSESILEELEGSHEIIGVILEWRKLKKLKTTYIDSLPEEINKKTGRIHTTFNQIGAITGRLSSNNPNLQNIPIRTKWGEEIRKAFVKKGEGFVFLSADYSQIELRVIAEASGEENMINAFRNNIDIHTDTASRVYKIPKEQVTREQRSNAKTINFGIIYGVSSYGLSRQTTLTNTEAKEIIQQYKTSYPKLEEYMKTVIKKVQEQGFIETLMGRKRTVEGINSNNTTLRNSAERNAINTSVQGTAADIIKIAMIAINNEFEARALHSKMTLQVHDELVFDVKIEELEEVKAIIKDKMENAVKFSTPLQIEIGYGENWLSAH